MTGILWVLYKEKPEPRTLHPKQTRSRRRLRFSLSSCISKTFSPFLSRDFLGNVLSHLLIFYHLIISFFLPISCAFFLSVLFSGIFEGVLLKHDSAAANFFLSLFDFFFRFEFICGWCLFGLIQSSSVVFFLQLFF